MLNSTAPRSWLVMLSCLLNARKQSKMFVAPWNFSWCSLNNMAFVSWVVCFVQFIAISSRSSSSPSFNSLSPSAIHMIILCLVFGSSNFILSTCSGIDTSRSGLALSSLISSSSGWCSEIPLWLTGLYLFVFRASTVVLSRFCPFDGTAIAVLVISSSSGYSQSQNT